MVWVSTLASDQQVADLRREPAGIYDFGEEAYNSAAQIDLDKQWHAVHFLLTGSAEATDSPLSLIIGYFEELGPDHGYGPAWLIPRQSLTDFHQAISCLSNEDLAKRYDPRAMVAEDVYLAEALAEEGDEALQFLLEDVDRLRAFADKAAAESMNAFGLIT